jgi:hypothetical protein
MQRYVAGFMFDGGRVVLVRKNKPEWQKGPAQWGRWKD